MPRAINTKSQCDHSNVNYPSFRVLTIGNQNSPTEPEFVDLTQTQVFDQFFRGLSNQEKIHVVSLKAPFSDRLISPIELIKRLFQVRLVVNEQTQIAITSANINGSSFPLSQRMRWVTVPNSHGKSLLPEYRKTPGDYIDHLRSEGIDTVCIEITSIFSWHPDTKRPNRVGLSDSTFTVVLPKNQEATTSSSTPAQEDLPTDSFNN